MDDARPAGTHGQFQVAPRPCELLTSPLLYEHEPPLCCCVNDIRDMRARHVSPRLPRRDCHVSAAPEVLEFSIATTLLLRSNEAKLIADMKT